MKNKPYDLFKMLLKTVFAEIIKVFVKDIELTFPKVIGDYDFINHFRKIGPRKSYKLAIYQNKTGKKAIAKMISAKIKSYHYYSLLNEIAIYNTLNSATDRLKKNTPPQYKDVYIPRLINSYEDGFRLISLVEFVAGEVVQNYSAKKKLELYIKITNYLNYIGENLTKAERSQISVRKSLNYIVLYPLLAVKAVITYPASLPYVLVGMIRFLRNIPIVLKNSKSSLIHRDLHFKNILTCENGHALIDFQQMVFSEPLHEYITTLRYFWYGYKRKEFGRLLLAEIIKKNIKRKKFNELFQSYAINSVTHGLTGSGFSRDIILGWFDFFKFSLNSDFTKFQTKNIL